MTYIFDASMITPGPLIDLTVNALAEWVIGQDEAGCHVNPAFREYVYRLVDEVMRPSADVRDGPRAIMDIEGESFGEPAPFITTAEAAERLGVGERQVCRLAAAGEIRGAKKVGRMWLIPDDFDAQGVLDV